MQAGSRGLAIWHEKLLFGSIFEGGRELGCRPRADNQNGTYHAN
jgi:hypothetical protein